MKIDKNIIKTILVLIEENRSNEILDESEILDDVNKKLKKNQKLYHLKILVERGFIEGAGVEITPNGEFIYWINKTPILTIEGHEFLDSLRYCIDLDRSNSLEKNINVNLDIQSIQSFNDDAMNILMGNHRTPD